MTPILSAVHGADHAEAGGIPGQLATFRSMIEDALQTAIPDRAGPARAARHSLLAGGKRLRGVMTLAACVDLGGDAEKALCSALAVEMVHTASLVFDDLPSMDDATLRRGAQTAHVAFGEDVAILAGIGLLNGAYEQLSKADSLPADVNRDLVNILTNAVGWEGLVHGQGLDLASTSEAATAEAVDEIHYGKTGALFVAAAELGGCVAHASKEQLAALRQYGIELGRAYQALDDVLDQAVDASVSGKTSSRDAQKSTALTANSAHPDIDRALRHAEQHLALAIRELTHFESHAPLLSALSHQIGVHFSTAFGSAVPATTAETG